MDQQLDVLVIDDDPSDRFIIEQTLLEEDAGHWSVQTAGFLKDGILLANSFRFDVVLLDLILPECRGLETVRRFREQAPDTPIIVLSGVHDETISMSALEEGAQDYFAKENIAYHSLTRSIQYAIQRHELQSRITDLAYTDPVTRLPNRIRFTQLLDDEFSKPPAVGQNLFVLFVDLDNFKLVNDTYGHEIGDSLLAEFGARISEAKHANDTVARFGGDEFVVMLKGDGDEYAQEFVDTLREQLRQPFNIGSGDYHVSASIGVVRLSERHNYPGDLLRDADTAMYRAKEEGKSRTQWFTQSMRSQALEKLAFESRLRLALARRQFELFYQPIIDMRSRKLLRFEALLRWRHPTDGLIPPNDFIAMLESEGDIVPVGSWVIEEACRQIAVWRDRYTNCEDLTVSINVSPVQLLQRDFIQHVINACKTADIHPSCLDLEVTETSIMKNPDKAYAVLRELREMGIRIHIDDFGTGYSSLSQLYEFEYDVLKIDKAFIASMLDDGDAFLRAILMLGDFLNLEVVAEGVESEEQAQLLLNLGCTVGQGYLFGKPLPAKEAIKRFVRRTRLETAKSEVTAQNAHASD